MSSYIPVRFGTFPSFGCQRDGMPTAIASLRCVLLWGTAETYTRSHGSCLQAQLFAACRREQGHHVALGCTRSEWIKPEWFRPVHSTGLREAHTSVACRLQCGLFSPNNGDRSSEIMSKQSWSSRIIAKMSNNRSPPTFAVPAGGVTPLG
jgi:hypothetical protein